jgi:hypothetical protein
MSCAGIGPRSLAFAASAGGPSTLLKAHAATYSFWAAQSPGQVTIVGGPADPAFVALAPPLGTDASNFDRALVLPVVRSERGDWLVEPWAWTPAVRLGPYFELEGAPPPARRLIQLSLAGGAPRWHVGMPRGFTGTYQFFVDGDLRHFGTLSDRAVFEGGGSFSEGEHLIVVTFVSYDRQVILGRVYRLEVTS